jgi:hypothetical protein
MLTDRDETLIYEVNAGYRTGGDPYTGCIAAIDYLECRTGPTYEDRDTNLVLVYGKVDVDSAGNLTVTGGASVGDYVDSVTRTYSARGAILLGQSYNSLRSAGNIPRYMMQVRHGTTYTKRKDVRIFAYFCDAILFRDGALWREA